MPFIYLHDEPGIEFAINKDPQSENRLLLRFPYDPIVADIIKSIPGARWVHDAKAWSISKKHSDDLEKFTGVRVPRT